jgi:hypothetical protein
MSHRAAHLSARARLAKLAIGCGLIAATTLLPAGAAHADAHDDFIATAGAAAQPSQAQYGVPASVTTAQAIVESGWGTSRFSRDENNYFGIQCGSSGHGPIAVGCKDEPTQECTPDCHSTVRSFRVYRTMADSFRDHGRLLRSNPRYANAFAHKNDPNQFARDIAADGYATDPNYASTLISIMRSHNLYRFDHVSAQHNNGGIDDVSGDGHADLLFTEGSSLQYLANRSGSNPGHVPFLGSSAQVARVGSDDLVAAGDLSGDGHADLLVYNRAAGKVSYLPNKSGTNPGHVPHVGTAAPVVSGLGNKVSKIMAADVSGDGRADLEFLKSDGTLWYLPNNASHNPGHVPFHGNATRIVSGLPSGAVVTLGDLTGDGHADLLYVSKGALMLLPNKSGSNPGHVPFHGTAAAINSRGFGSVVQLTAADVSGDGHADLLFTNADEDVYELDDRSSTNPGHAYFAGNAKKVAHIGSKLAQLV